MDTSNTRILPKNIYMYFAALRSMAKDLNTRHVPSDFASSHRNFEWSHPIHKGDAESMIAGETSKKHSNYSFITVPVDDLAQIGTETSAGRVVSELGSRLYTNRHLQC